MLTDTLLARDLVPDTLLRQGIRRLLRQRLRDEDKGSPDARQAHFMAWVEELKRSPIAIEAPSANAQHYEVPTEFYRHVLGNHMKYSCALWPETTPNKSGTRYYLRKVVPGTTFVGGGLDSLSEAEEAMLELTCERAELADGQDILELGCGWGSLALFMAARYPQSRIKAVSNSRTQKAWIDEQSRLRGLKNLEILTEDMNRFEAVGTFDRVVSVEMFEHMRNYQALLANIARWLRPAGKLFVHLFAHRELAYPFDAKDATDWLSKNFFTGGQMPSDDLLLYFQRDLTIESHWQVSGTHYRQTAEAWLANMDRNRAGIFPILETTYGPAAAPTWWAYWRLFFMACAELWGFRGGTEWLVSHYLFRKPGPGRGAPGTNG